jgi:kynurenine formamidase
MAVGWRLEVPARRGGRHARYCTGAPIATGLTGEPAFPCARKQSPFGVPLREKYRPTVGIAGTRHAFNGEETVSGEPGAQGTQMDAIGHFAVLPEAWDGKGEFPADKARYYGGHTQADVKPTPDSPLQKLGIEKVPPIITSAVLLDAKSYVGRGSAMQPGQVVTAADIEAMLKAQALEKRGLIPGDVLYIYTGWGDNWKDPDVEKFYYTKGPGLAYDAARYIAEKQVVLLALDNPFTDPVAEGFLQGKAPPPAGAPAGLPFAIHHTNLAESGIYQIQNANLGALAQDKAQVGELVGLRLGIGKVGCAALPSLGPERVGHPNLFVINAPAAASAQVSRRMIIDRIP